MSEDDNVYARAAERQRLERQEQTQVQQEQRVQERLRLEALYAAGESWWQNHLVREVELAKKGLPHQNFKLETVSVPQRIGFFQAVLTVGSNYPLLFKVEIPKVEVYRDTRKQVSDGRSNPGKLFLMDEYGGSTNDSGYAQRILMKILNLS